MNLMIDIETLGTNNNCPVISIGACMFDKNGIKDKFYIVLDIAEQIDSGKRMVDASTIKWWMSQEDAAKKIFRDGEYESVKKALSRFNEWFEFAKSYHCKNKADIKPWGNGSNFDIVILESLFKDYGFDIPWNFRNIRDLRTFKEYIYDGSETELVGTHHNALDDALYQAQIVIDGLNKYDVIKRNL